MPRKNSEDRGRIGAYHVYNRGRDGCSVFRDDHDRRHFLSLISTLAARFEGAVSVHSYCLMTTHYHLILGQNRPDELARFMAALIAAYVKYFNRRHHRGGALFAGPYRSRRFDTPKQFRWAVGYVHDNHPTGVNYRFSSHRAWIDEHKRPTWLSVEPALRQFGDEDGYKRFLKNRDTRKSLQSEFFDQ